MPFPQRVREMLVHRNEVYMCVGLFVCLFVCLFVGVEKGSLCLYMFLCGKARCRRPARGLRV